MLDLNLQQVRKVSKFSDGYDKIDWSKKVGRKKSAQLPDTQKTFMLLPKFEEFVSPIDKSIISDRGSLRAHNKKHEVTNVRDYGEKYFDRRGKEKYADQQGSTSEQRKERKELINQEMRKRGM